MEAIKEKWKRRLLYPAALLKWLVFSLLIGVAVGAVGALFHHAIEAVSALREAHGWLIFLLPLGGASIILLYRVCGMERDRGPNFVLAAVRENEPMRLRTAPLIIAATVITHLVGGSAGREGAALQMGGAISGRLGRWMRLDEKDERIITMCGMSAGFAALFGTPLAAAVFSMEMVSVGVMYYAAMVPCLLSALIARLTAGLLGAVPAAFDLAALPELSAPNMARLAVLGVLCALLSILFCTAMHQAARFYGRVTDKPVVRAVSFMLSGYSGLYSEQKIIYSKLRPEYINKKTD